MLRMNILFTVNSTWNIWNFRKPLVRALIDAGHEVTILAPCDETVPELEAIGCQVRHLDMSVKGLNPVVDFGLLLRFRKVFRELSPHVS